MKLNTFHNLIADAPLAELRAREATLEAQIAASKEITEVHMRHLAMWAEQLSELKKAIGPRALLQHV